MDSELFRPVIIRKTATLIEFVANTKPNEEKKRTFNNIAFTTRWPNTCNSAGQRQRYRDVLIRIRLFVALSRSQCMNLFMVLNQTRKMRRDKNETMCLYIYKETMKNRK